MTIRKTLLVCLLTLSTAFSSLVAGEGELRFAWWGGAERHEATLKALETFEALTPGVKIKGEYMGWNGYLERLTTQIGGDSEADIIQMDWAWLALFSKDGNGFYDLKQAGDAVNLGAYDAKWLDTTMVKGKLNALPVSFTTRFFVWNKTAFDKAGVPVPKTWEDIYAAGKVFKEKLGNDYYPLDLNLNSVTHMMTSYIYQKTGRMIINPETSELGLTRDDLKEMLAFYRRLIDSHAITSLEVRSSRSGDPDSQAHEQPDYIEGKWCGTYVWDSNITLVLSTPKKEFEFVLGVYPISAESKNPGRIGRPAQIFAVSKNSKNPKAAAACISFLLTTPEAARILKTTRGALISNPSFAALEKESLIAPVVRQAMEQLKGVEVKTPSPYFEDPRMLKLLDTVVENISYGKISVDEGADELLQEIPKLLKRLTR